MFHQMFHKNKGRNDVYKEISHYSYFTALYYFCL